MKIKFFKSKEGPAIPIYTICEIIEQIEKKPFPGSSPGEQPLNYYAKGRTDLSKELVKKFKQVGDQIEFQLQ